MLQKNFFGAVCALLCIFVCVQCESENQFKPIPNSSRLPLPEKEIEVAEVKTLPSKAGKKYLYITFDDGPNKGTQNIVEVLKKEQIPATLFLVGEHIFGSKAQWKDFELILQDTLFQIGNHSYSHAKNQFTKYYRDSAQVLADFNRFNDSLKRKSMIARTPGRNIWRIGKLSVTDIKSSKAPADYLAKNGFKLVGWDIEWKSDSNFKAKESSQEILNLIDSAFVKKSMKTENHLVLLTHDQYFRDSVSLKELSKFLQTVKSREDIELKKIKDYPGIAPVLH